MNKENEKDDNDDDVLFVCPICGNDELMISNDDAIVFVPVVGQKTCLELETRALQGKIDETMLPQEKALDRQITNEETTKHMLTENNKT